MRRVVSFAFVVAIITSATMVAAASPAGACSCGEVDDATAFDNADAVFIGQVVRTYPAREGEPVAVVVLQVSDVFKGDVNRLQGIATPADDTCADHLDGDGISLVFATRDGSLDLEDGFYETNTCTGTRLLDDAGEIGFDATPYAPNDTGAPSTAEIRAQLGDPRSSIFPEAFIFVGVLGFILALAAWFSWRNRPAT